MFYYDDSRAERRSRTAGAVAVAVYAVAAVALLLWLKVPAREELTGNEGILIAFGEPDASVSDFDSALPTVTETQEEELLTQDFEEAPEVAAQPEERPQQPAEARQPEPKPERRPDPAALFPGRAAQQGAESQGEGRQGAPLGSAEGSPTGTGQGSTGSGFDLSGRHLQGSLPSPAYPSNRSGRVVIDIAVDADGKVVRAAYRPQGSTTSDRALITAAEEAARRARFDVATDAPDQHGTITYNFILK
jgi:TonB family protein